MYPFLFRLFDHRLYDSQGDKAADRWVVKIASFDYKHYDSSWMCDETLGNDCLVPDVDQVKEEHRFTSEKEAMDFIRDWWIKQGL